MAELGNYKGVMLCNRPTASDAKLKEAAVRPFRSAIPATVGDALGLYRKKEAMPEVKSRGPSAALRRHCRWVKELQHQVAQDAAAAEEAERGKELKQQRMKEVFRRQREALRLLKLGDARAEELTSALNPKAKLKPLWALTDAEREDREEQNAGELIDFAEALDYDEYIHDLEFRECLQAITDRAKKLHREQQSFKDSLLKEFQGEDAEEEPSVPGSPGRAGSIGTPASLDRPAWDAAPVSAEALAAKQLTDRAWQDGQLKGVHSKQSLQKLAERELH
ncbi:unnamed protein product [Symbiodinium pilosum]|uniref:Uncharacterized protein n=1 Tax=Symbiodinium pilosum TaxID=2952 RepID=A0A812THW9_SYMPI|nr:unnamed protein product [Symbiodinium pilosum]